MSVPAVGWALERGRALDLSNNERLVLIVLADRANGKRVCWPSLKCLASDTGLVERTVFTVVHQLEAAGLIRIEKRGRGQDYHILRPADEAEPTQPLQRSKRGNGADYPRAPKQPLHQSEPQSTQQLHQSDVDNSQRPMQSTQRPMQMTTTNDAIIANQPIKNQEEPKTRASAREEGQEDQGWVGGDPAYSLPLPPQYRPAPRRPDPEPVAEPVSDANRLAAQTIIGKVGRSMSFKAMAPGRFPSRSPQEQIDAAQAEPTIPKPTGAVLDAVLAARRDLAARAAQRMGAVA